MSDSISCSYQLTEDDFEQISSDIFQISGVADIARTERRKRLRSLVIQTPIVCLAIFGALVLVVIVGSGPSNERTALLYGLGIFLLIWICLIAYQYFSNESTELLRSQVSLYLKTRYFPAVFQKHDVRFMPSGIEMSDHLNRVLLPWSRVLEIVRVKGSLYVMPWDGNHIMIPHHAMSEQQWKTLIPLIESWWDGDRVMDEITKSHLQERYLACSNCRHLLNGIDNAKCPECGVRVKPFDLGRASTKLYDQKIWTVFNPSNIRNN